MAKITTYIATILDTTMYLIARVGLPCGVASGMNVHRQRCVACGHLRGLKVCGGGREGENAMHFVNWKPITIPFSTDTWLH